MIQSGVAIATVPGTKKMNKAVLNAVMAVATMGLSRDYNKLGLYCM
jgi:hypothetical protein